MSKTKEEILDGYDIIVYQDSPYTQGVAYESTDVMKAMDCFGKQQAISFQEWVEEYAMKVFGGWIYKYDEVGNAVTIDKLYDLFLQSKTQTL